MAFREETRDFWQARTEEEISHEDARQITENAAEYFKILQEWASMEQGNMSETVQLDTPQKEDRITSNEKAKTKH